MFFTFAIFISFQIYDAGVIIIFLKIEAIRFKRYGFCRVLKNYVIGRRVINTRKKETRVSHVRDYDIE